MLNITIDSEGTNVTNAGFFKINGLGVPDIGEGAEWCITPGVMPYIGEYIVDEGFGFIKNDEVTIEVGSSGSNSIEIKKLYRIDDEYASPGMRRIYIADMRWMWKFVKTSKIYNHTRQSGELEYNNDFSDSGFARYRYSDFSLNPKTGTAWTAIEIIQDILKNDLNVEVEVDKEVKKLKNPYVPDNVNLIGLEAPQALAQVLSQSNCQIHPTVDGKIRLYYMYSDLNKWKVEASTLTGALEVAGIWIKPKYLKVLFVKEKEQMFSKDSTVHGIYNVMQLPLDVTIGGTEFGNRGEYKEFQTAIRTCLGGTSFKFDDFIRYFAHPTGLERLFLDVLKYQGYIQPTEEDAVKMSFLAASRRDFRTLWKINQTDMDKIIEINPYMGEIIDPLSMSRAISPVYADWCELWRIAKASSKKGGEVKCGQNHAYNSINPRPAPAIVNIVNADMGVIRAEFGYDQTMLAQRRYFGNFEKIPQWRLWKNPLLWNDRKCRLEQEGLFQFRTVLSIVEADDALYTYPPKGKGIPLKYGGNKKTSNGSEINKPSKETKELTLYIFSMKERARVASEFFGYEKDTLRNEKIIKDIASVLEKEEIQRQWDDKVVGSVTTEFTVEKKQLEGYQNALVFHIGEGGTYTTFDFSVLPPAPNKWSQMSNQLRALIFKSLSSINKQ